MISNWKKDSWSPGLYKTNLRVKVAWCINLGRWLALCSNAYCTVIYHSPSLRHSFRALNSRSLLYKHYVPCKTWLRTCERPVYQFTQGLRAPECTAQSYLTFTFTYNNSKRYHMWHLTHLFTILLVNFCFIFSWSASWILSGNLVMWVPCDYCTLSRHFSPKIKFLVLVW